MNTRQQPIPRAMKAATIRRSRYGPPASAFQFEQVPVPSPGPGQVLVQVMAAGINFNGVWAAMGAPVDVIGHQGRAGPVPDYHIAGSDASGIVVGVGDDSANVKIGDAVVISCGQYPHHADCNRFDPGIGPTIWGYESNHGAFAEYALVDAYQCHPKPRHLTWEAAACFLLTGATAYRQLMSWPPHTVGPSDVVLIWGGAGGLGSAAIQLVRHQGGIPVAVVSSPGRASYCQSLGALTLDRSGFTHWEHAPGDDTVRTEEMRRFGRAIWELTGTGASPHIVLEHSGSLTLGTSLYVCAPGGMVVTCGATSGFNCAVDLRHLWMRQKRLQGSHFATVEECARVVELVAQGSLDPCLSLVFPFDRIGEAHQLMHDNRHPPGNMALLVAAPAAGLGIGHGQLS